MANSVVILTSPCGDWRRAPSTEDVWTTPAPATWPAHPDVAEALEQVTRERLASDGTWRD